MRALQVAQGGAKSRRPRKAMREKHPTRCNTAFQRLENRYLQSEQASEGTT